MAGVAHSLRLCLRGCSNNPIVQKRMGGGARKPFAGRRPLSNTPTRWRVRVDEEEERQSQKPGPFDKWVEEAEEMEQLTSRGVSLQQSLEQVEQDWLKEMTEEQRAVVEQQRAKFGSFSQQIDPALQAEWSKTLNDINKAMPKWDKVSLPKKHTFWHEEEPDLEMVTDELNEDEFEEDDITSMAHGKLEELREHREYARITAWEMPLLAKFVKPFEPPPKDACLRFRYTSYMGEFHPAEKKVVLQFCPADLDLTDAQQRKLKKLVGPRYNPEKDIVHMSCEMFEHQAQNKRYLGDLVEKVIAEAKDPTDSFEDVPLDVRHHDFKIKPKFPKEWRMTEERRKELQEIRAQSFVLDAAKEADGTLVDGRQRIQAALAPPAQKLSDKVAELVTAPARSRGAGPRAMRR